ncbi:twitching motility protein pilT [Vibrio ishigakensis]|uniref:Twitching motility protein pilT n=1 Tax=Vibrio ishigakensis TaxID=1481914 RepID=A0A0B8P0E4_9VIBR|nr:twitching motility protein pilT [Vibrio ishigakensis]
MVRIDGDVRRLEIDALTENEVHNLVFDIMDDAQRSEFEAKLEIDFSIELQSVGRFRVNAFQQSRGASAVFRTIPTVIPSLEELETPRSLKRLPIMRRA